MIDHGQAIRFFQVAGELGEEFVGRDADGCGEMHLVADALLELSRDVAADIGGDDQDPLRRHKSAHPIHHRIGVLERAKGRGVAGKDAENAPPMAHSNLTLHELARLDIQGRRCGIASQTGLKS